MKTTRSLTTLFLCVTLGTLVGCSTFQKKDETLLSASPKPKKSLFDRMPWSKKDDTPEPYPNPVKLAATWTPDTLTQTGRVATRGFGARVFFYDEKSRPVPVDGTLVVHAFDELDAGKNGQPQIKRYEFTPEQFTRHFSQSDLGASYSVWIPWDAVGGKQSRVSLVASFSTAEGKMVQGTPTTVLLPGAKDGSAATLAARFAPEYREWQVASSGSQAPTSGLTTTTIHRTAPAVRSMPMLPEPGSSSPNWNVAGNSASSVEVAMKTSAMPATSGTPVIPASTQLKK